MKDLLRCFSILVSSSLLSIAPALVIWFWQGRSSTNTSASKVFFSLFPLWLLLHIVFYRELLTYSEFSSSQMKAFILIIITIKLFILLESMFDVTIYFDDFYISQLINSTLCSFLFSAWTWIGFLHLSIFLGSLWIWVGLMISSKRT